MLSSEISLLVGIAATSKLIDWIYEIDEIRCLVDQHSITSIESHLWDKLKSTLLLDGLDLGMTHHDSLTELEVPTTFGKSLDNRLALGGYLPLLRLNSRGGGRRWSWTICLHKFFQMMMSL